MIESPKVKYTRNRRHKFKETVLAYKQSRCCICGYNKCNKALEFHHINPSDKKFNITQSSYNKSIDLVLEELDKCILVCANCHREIHDNLHTHNYIESLLSIKDEKTFNEMIDSSKNKTKRKTCTCTVCNKVFYPTSRKKDKEQDCCSRECASKLKLKANKPSREELKQLIESKSFVEIGKIHNVSDNAVRKWCKLYGLPHRKKDLNRI